MPQTEDSLLFAKNPLKKGKWYGKVLIKVIEKEMRVFVRVFIEGGLF